MKAVRVNEWAQPIQVEDIPQPTPGEGEVLVKVKAASVNPVDGFIALGYMAQMLTAPMTLGTDYSGEVAAIGAGVDHVKPGDAVYGQSPAYGTFAEYVNVKANGVAPKPQTVDDVHAAAVPLTGLSAWQTLFNTAQLKPGERILIHGAGGGVGTLAVQLAKNAGAYIIAHDKGDKEALVRQLGADQFINADTQRFEDEAGKLDVILDLVGRDLVERSWALCETGTRYVTTAAMIDPQEAAKRGINASGQFTQPTVADLTSLAELIDSGKLKPVVSRTFPIEDAPTAINYKQQDSTPGKVVITVA